jgi:glycosyltransferase involved in cell wall biosynthesis
MKILIVSYFFPPYNVIGAVRVGKLAEYWSERGHDVRVISADNQPLAKTLKTRLPNDKIVYTKWINVNKLPELVLGGRKKVMSHGFSSKSSLLGKLGLLYKTCFNLPDGQVGWYPFAISNAKKMIASGWQPDLIYASAHPLTSLMVANKISKFSKTPWVAEFRDLWTDNHNYHFPQWRRRIETKLESKVLSTAYAAVTVSEPLANTLRNKLDIPVATILNGFDKNDIQSDIAQLPANKTINIVYTGMVYSGKQDIELFFKALKIFKRPDCISVNFYGRYLNEVKHLTTKYNLEDVVKVNEPVSYLDSIKIQKNADILLFLLWNDIKEKGVFTGKLFEYFGALRPILAIGNQYNVAAELILERKAGIVSINPEEIAQQLETWVNLKNLQNETLSLPATTNLGLSRTEQFDKLDTFLKMHRLIKD